MPATANKITADILAAANGSGFNGPVITPIAMGIGLAVAEWLPEGVVIKCGLAGFAGSGVVTGALVVPPLPAAAVLFASQGMSGPQSAALITAITAGISTSVSGLPFVGDSSSVGAGGGLGKVTSVNAASLAAKLMQNLPPTLGTEVETGTQIQFCSAVGTVIAAQLLLGVGAGGVAGIPTPASAVGTATCKVVIT